MGADIALRKVNFSCLETISLIPNILFFISFYITFTPVQNLSNFNLSTASTPNQ